MLELKNIQKIYPAAGENVHALKGISLTFGENEFVSVLGPSGCGKTTLLNIIGGLDHYTSGDLVINGVSTTKYKDRDWDAYRNHSIGFVFQNYNLIPHQTVLQNVELALTLAGVSKKERREKAKAALKKVGLESQYRKKPSEMSGGQMQRVAIARAIVNDPDIILADEPTGALDTETSVQVMDILKEISKEHLIIMVTHNPELAEKYSTRIIRMLDGSLISDTEAVPEKEEKQPSVIEVVGEKVQDNADERKAPAAAVRKNRPNGRKKMPSMSLWTSFGLSLKNLFSKKGRTILTSFAGSIGIIGIALIYAVSNGMTGYIDLVQEQTLSSYPLTLQAQSVDIGSLLSAFMETATSKGDHENDKVYEKSMVASMVNALTNMETKDNDLRAFKEYLTEKLSEDDGDLKDALNAIQYSYDLDFTVYTENSDGDIIESDSTTMMKSILAKYMGTSVSDLTTSADSASSVMSSSSILSSLSGSTTSSNTLWQELIPGENGETVSDLIKEQYDLVYGSWPENYNEVVLVLDENNELSDIVLYALGLLPEEDIEAIVNAENSDEDLETDAHSYTYEEICAKSYKTFLPSECYKYDETTGTWTDLRETDSGLRLLYSSGIELKVTGIIRPEEDSIASVMTGAIGYTSDLTEYIIEQAKESDAAEAQMADPMTDIFTGLRFKDTDGALSTEEKAAAFREAVEDADTAEQADIYLNICSIMPDDMLAQSLDQAMEGFDRETAEQTMTQAMSSEMGMSSDEIAGYFADMSDDDLKKLYEEAVTSAIEQQYAAGVQEQMSKMTDDQLAAAMQAELTGWTDEECAKYYDEVLNFSDSTYEDNLVKLGVLDMDSPSAINLYASSFENKEVLEDEIAAYNESVDEAHQIEYTDYVGLMMSSVTTIINAITYVLIAFVAISLIVSSIMIGVITLISVQERTKEIGVLRAIGASKRNVSNMFNAETVIIGFTSGLLGIVVTELLIIPINLILHKLTGIGNLSASLPWNVALILIVISMLLTLLAGLIPSRSASKKDPVVALRTE